MTREKAIKNLKSLVEVRRKYCDMQTMKDEIECLEMAIEALEQGSCDDAISRQAVLNALYALCDTGETLAENPWRDNPHIDALVDAVEDLPSVTPQPKIGHWIEVAKYSDGKHKIECSECGRYIFDRGHANSAAVKEKYKFCPNCGYRMKGESE